MEPLTKYYLKNQASNYKSEMMKILYDHQAFTMQTHGGVTRCFAELISNLPDDISSVIAVKESDNVYLKEKQLVKGLKPLSRSRSTFLGGVNNPLKEFLFNSLNYIPGVRTPKVINRDYSLELIRKGDYDVFHPTFFDEYFLPYLNDKPFVLTVHDLISERMERDKHRNDSQIGQRKRLVKKAAHIVAVSENTKQDLIELLDVPEQKISVIYHGGPDVDLTQIGSEPIVKGKYILFVGARNVVYKNFKPFVTQCTPLLQADQSLKIVCTGTPFTEDELALFSTLGIARQMLQMFVSSSELYNLYHHARAFVFPSAYEGFGIPILEAFACNCPVLLNHASCFPEIAGEAANYFDINKEKGDCCLAEVVQRLLCDEKERNRKILQGEKRLQDFSWEKSAMQLAEIYRSLL